MGQRRDLVGDIATASTLTVDLDLLVRDSRGVQVASAASWDNSYEVVEFAGAEVRPTRSSSAGGRVPTASGTAWRGR